MSVAVTASPFFQPVSGIPPFQPIAGGVFSLGPELAPWGPSDQFLFAFAVGTDQALWYAQLDGFTSDVETPAAWSGWRSLGGVVTSPPCAVRSAESSVDVFAVDANSELLHWQFRNGTWVNHPPVFEDAASAARVGGVSNPVHAPVLEEAATPALERRVSPPVYTRYWESLGGILTSPPHAVIFGESGDEILVFARGIDHALWTRAFVNGSWRAWDSLGHILASPPHAVVAAKETLAVFALGTDSAIWYTMGGEWQSLGGTYSSPPYAVAHGSSIHVFAADSQSALAWRKWDGSAWNSWQSLGGILMSPPIADCPPEGLPYVFTLGTDSGVWRKRSAGGSGAADWFDWESLGIGLLSLPATTVRTPNDLFQFRALAALGPDHQVWFQEDDF
jgi:hypothetical protein